MTTRWSDFSNSPYMSANDFAVREERRLTVQAVRIEPVGREQNNKPVAYFAERDAKPLILNKVNQRQLAVCGPTTEDCRGAIITLHVIETEFGGEPVRGIRIRTVVPPPPADFAPNAKQRAQQAPVPEPEYSDDIPF